MSCINLFDNLKETIHGEIKEQNMKNIIKQCITYIALITHFAPTLPAARFAKTAFKCAKQAQVITTKSPCAKAIIAQAKPFAYQPRILMSQPIHIQGIQNATANLINNTNQVEQKALQANFEPKKSALKLHTNNIETTPKESFFSMESQNSAPDLNNTQIIHTNHITHQKARDCNKFHTDIAISAAIGCTISLCLYLAPYAWQALKASNIAQKFTKTVKTAQMKEDIKKQNTANINTPITIKCTNNGKIVFWY